MTLDTQGHLAIVSFDSSSDGAAAARRKRIISMHAAQWYLLINTSKPRVLTEKVEVISFESGLGQRPFAVGTIDRKFQDA